MNVNGCKKRIYNTHLEISRKARNEPFRLRKDFSDLDEDVLVSLDKLEKLFDRYPNLDMDDFFLAPHRIYPDEDWYPLEFYTTQKAITCYTQYMKMVELQDPDSPESLKRLIAGLSFVGKFCKEKGLLISDYELNMEGTMPCFVEHLKNHKINYYTLHALTFRKPDVESRILEFIFPDFHTVFRKTRNKFYTSRKMRGLAKQARQKLDEQLKEQIEKQTENN